MEWVKPLEKATLQLVRQALQMSLSTVPGTPKSYKIIISELTISAFLPERQGNAPEYLT